MNEVLSFVNEKTKVLLIFKENQLEIEGKYARELSFMLDLKIFFYTFIVLFKRMKYDYGEYIRPALNEEREAKEEEINVWVMF